MYKENITENQDFVYTISPKTELLKKISVFQAHFESLKRKASARTNENDKISGSLRIANGAHGPQYFHITQKGDTKGRYLSLKNKEDMTLARNLAQQDYYDKTEKLSEEWLKCLEKVERAVNRLPSESSVFLQQSSRRCLIKPLVSEMTDEEYKEKWQSVEYKGKQKREDGIYIKTNRGDLVRSKSECLIANKLDSMGIPYRYEYPHILKATKNILKKNPDGKTHIDSSQCKIIFYPDFTILGPGRHEIIIEHFGMMDNPDYSKRVVQKMNIYAQNGYFPGDNFLATYETENCPFDIKIFEKMILNLFSK